MSASRRSAWTDSHCHIQDAYLEDPGGAEAVIRRAAAAGVDRLVCIGTAEEESRQAVELARSEVGPRAGVAVWAAVGLHPHEASHGVAVDRRPRGDGSGACRAGSHPGRWSPSASAGSTTTTTTRRAMPSARPSPRRSRSPNSTASPSSSTPGDAWDDTFDILAVLALPERTVIHCFTGERPRRVAASISAPTSRSAGSSHSRTRAASGRRPPRARGPPARRDGLTLPRARPASRQAERTGLRHDRRCRARRGARRTPRGPRGGDERQRIGCLLARRLSHGRATTARTA